MIREDKRQKPSLGMSVGEILFLKTLMNFASNWTSQLSLIILFLIKRCSHLVWSREPGNTLHSPAQPSTDQHCLAFICSMSVLYSRMVECIPISLCLFLVSSTPRLLKRRSGGECLFIKPRGNDFKHLHWVALCFLQNVWCKRSC